MLYEMVFFRIKFGWIFLEFWVFVDIVDWKGDVCIFGNSVFFYYNIFFCKFMSFENVISFCSCVVKMLRII